MGAFLFLSALPLHHLFLTLWGASLFATVTTEFSSRVVYSTSIRVYWPGLFLSGAACAALVAPSLAATVWTVGPRFHRFLLVAFLPVSALLSLVASDLASPDPLFVAGPIQVPTWLAVTPPLGSSAFLVLGYVVGVPTASLGLFARRLLATQCLWLTLLEWNGVGLPIRYFPGWVGAAGAAMILLGESLARRPAPVILDS
ncbi:MAG TPA: hypothetical protein VF950_00080 [Planctomycetota bacterium]